MSPVTTEPAQNSPLLKIPAELRNRIYEIVIESKPRIASSCTCRKGLHTVGFTAEYRTCEPALLAVSRKIRREAKGMFYARRACKVVLLARGWDEPEMTYWENQLVHLFSQPGNMASEFPVEDDPPNLATWKPAIKWLWEAQIKFSHGDSAGEDGNDFDSEDTVIFCAVDEVAWNSGRKPWDLVGDEYSHIKYLLSGFESSSKEDNRRFS